MSRSSESGSTAVNGAEIPRQSHWKAEHPGSHVRYATQPIVDRTGRVVATELLFRWNARDDGVRPELGAYATAAALSSALIDGELLTGAPAAEPPVGDLLVNMDRETLMSPIAEALTPDVGVIELLETIAVDAALVQRIRALHGRGYRFALDDIVRVDDARWALAPWVQFAKIDVIGLDPAQLEALIGQSHRLGMSVIAEKIEDGDALQQALQAGADYFQGYGIARPTTLTVPALPGCDAGIVGRLLLMARSGATASSLALVAGHHPALVARLLRVRAIHAPHGVATSESLTDVLESLPRAILIAWLLVLSIAAVHGRERELAQALRGELADGRLRWRHEGLASTSATMEQVSFQLCKQLLQMLPLPSVANLFQAPGSHATPHRHPGLGGGTTWSAA